MADNTMAEIGRSLIPELRSYHGLTCKQLAAKAGISENYLESIERGAKPLTLRTLFLIDKTLDGDLIWEMVEQRDALMERGVAL